VNDEQRLAEDKVVIKSSTESVEPSAASSADFPDLGTRYDVIEFVGEGGMGRVYKVSDKELNCTLAAKFIRKELAEDKQAVKRFEQEIKAASELSHLNLVSVYGHGRTASNVPYLLMDYVEGTSLADVLKNGPLNPDRAVNIFTQVCRALEFAHRSNVIHRDLKPSNIMLKKTDSGHDDVRVLDFGIAKILASEGADFSRTNLTQTGDVFGSPLYMSPEQCQNNPQDARSDVYSFGCVMYEALSGVQPFLESNPVKIILKHMNYEPPLVSTKCINSSRAAAFDGIIQKCLEKAPEDRYQTISELIHDLDAVAHGKSVSAKVKQRNADKQDKPSKPVARTRKYVAATIAAIIIGASLAVITEGVKLYSVMSGAPNPAPGGDDYTDAKNLDAKSYGYFVRGEYEKSAPLLEFGIATYRERIEQDKANNDNEQLLRDETFLNENIQHVGKCYLEIAKQAKAANNKEKAGTYFNKALERYREAMKFWERYSYSNLHNTMAPEAVSEYEFVLRELNLSDELAALQAWAAK